MKALFIGAGFSYECGMPLVWELTAEIRRWLTPDKLVSLNKNWKKQSGGWDHDVLSTVLALLENKKLHYENIIGAIEVEYSRERVPSKRQNYYAAVGFLLQAVYGLLLEIQVKNNRYALCGLDYFNSLKNIAEENRPLWIFSLNHDCIIEMLATKLGIPLKSGFNESINISLMSADGAKHDIEFDRLSRKSIVSNNYEFFKYGEFGINLIKLHGALDIFGQNDELNYLKIKSIPNNPELYASHLHLINEINHDFAVRNRVYCTNESVYEDEKGEIQFLRKTLLSGAHKFSEKISQIAPSEFLSLFKGNLNYANELICIGYGFGDKHIDNQFIEWMSFLKTRKLTIVNPGIKECPASMKHLSAQVNCKPIGTTDYFIELSDRKYNILDKIFRKIRFEFREKSKRALIKNAT